LGSAPNEPVSDVVEERRLQRNLLDLSSLRTDAKAKSLEEVAELGSAPTTTSGELSAGEPSVEGVGHSRRDPPAL
jgi:hypothetical protein